MLMKLTRIVEPSPWFANSGTETRSNSSKTWPISSSMSCWNKTYHPRRPRLVSTQYPVRLSLTKEVTSRTFSYSSKSGASLSIKLWLSSETRSIPMMILSRKSNQTKGSIAHLTSPLKPISNKRTMNNSLLCITLCPIWTILSGDGF